MNVPIYSDPEVLEGLYKRFSCLSSQPLRLYGVAAAASSIGTIETDALLAFVAAHLHEAVPYRADFPLLSRAENASLTHYAEVEALGPTRFITTSTPFLAEAEVDLEAVIVSPDDFPDSLRSRTHDLRVVQQVTFG